MPFTLSLSAVLLAVTLLLPSPAGAADGLRFTSGAEQTVMIELFTSQGCSSCPPAEAYVNRFSAHPALWKKFIPLAFHVDYWDYRAGKTASPAPRTPFASANMPSNAAYRRCIPRRLS